MPPILLAGLISTASEARKNEKTLDNTSLEMEVISQCGFIGLEDYKPSQPGKAKMKLKGQLDVIEYSRITVPESVHMGNPAGGYVELLKARNSMRGHLMTKRYKEATHEYLKELMMGSNLKRKLYDIVMSSGATKAGLKLLVKISWRTVL